MLGSWKAGLDALRKEGARLVDTDGTEYSTLKFRQPMIHANIEKLSMCLSW